MTNGGKRPGVKYGRAAMPEIISKIEKANIIGIRPGHAHRQKNQPYINSRPVAVDRRALNAVMSFAALSSSSSRASIGRSSGGGRGLVAAEIMSR